MRLFLIITEQDGLRAVRTNLHDAELSKTKIVGGTRLIFQFPSEDTARNVWMKLTEVHQLTPEELEELRSQNGHVYARVKTLEPLLNPPKQYSREELNILFKGTRKGRLEVLMEILARAEELSDKRIIEMTKNTMKQERIPDNIQAILIKFYEDKIHN